MEDGVGACAGGGLVAHHDGDGRHTVFGRGIAHIFDGRLKAQARSFGVAADIVEDAIGGVVVRPNHLIRATIHAHGKGYFAEDFFGQFHANFDTADDLLAFGQGVKGGVTGSRSTRSQTRIGAVDGHTQGGHCHGQIARACAGNYCSTCGVDGGEARVERPCGDVGGIGRGAVVQHNDIFHFFAVVNAGEGVNACARFAVAVDLRPVLQGGVRLIHG